jgi:hypothetical protein
MSDEIAAEANLKRKYELLKQKQLEKQKSISEAGASEASSASAAAAVPRSSAPTTSSSLGLPRLGAKPRDSGGDVVVSAASIDRSQIEFFKSTTKQKSTLQRPDSEPLSKKTKYHLPALPKKEKKPEGNSGGQADEDEISKDERQPITSTMPPPGETSERKEGFLKNVHDALERFFKEVGPHRYIPVHSLLPLKCFHLCERCLNLSRKLAAQTGSIIVRHFWALIASMSDA